MAEKCDAEQLLGNAGSDWLIYQHRSIHEGNKVSCIWDDYPCNIGLSRKLQPARRLVLRGVAHTSDRALLQVVFWIGDQPVGLTWKIERDGEFSVSSDEALPVNDVPVTTVAPVALRVVAGDLKLSRLQLSRQIEYRLRPHDDHTCYPMELANDEYFVVGDNVPVSLDSRNFGVIHVVMSGSGKLRLPIARLVNARESGSQVTAADVTFEEKYLMSAIYDLLDDFNITLTKLKKKHGACRGSESA